MSRERFYVTTPIYYVNDVPHLGHAYTTVVADVLAGYHRLLGIPTWFLTGTDEHGQKAQNAAEARGISPQQLCDEYSAVFRELGKRLAIRNDVFIRTTEPRHKDVVTHVLQRLWDKGEIYKADYEGFYCARCERYWNDTEVAAHGGNCPDQPELHGAVPRLKEPNYFFRMSKWADALKARIESGEMQILPEKRKNEVLGYLKGGVEDLCISRAKTRLSWGITLPFDRDFVCYVWLDALFNYETGAGYLQDEALHARWWPADLHVVGKDILTTHSVYWPTFLMAVGEPLPRRILAHGWLLDSEGLKLSKTKRLGLASGGGPLLESGGALLLEGTAGPPQPTIDELLEVLGVDVTRWALATAMKYGDDARFDWDLVRERVNAELANGLGNSVNRVLRMAQQSAGGKLAARGDGNDKERGLRARAEAAISAVNAVPETLDVLAVTAAVRAAVDAVSLYLDEEKPWKAAKDPANLPRVGEVLSWCVETLRLAGLALTPITPEKSERLRASLGLTVPLDFARESRWGFLPVGTALGDPPNLFPRVEAP
jgi:methionyl-tRNA synthetase